MSNQVQRPGVQAQYDPDAIFYPNGTQFVPQGNITVGSHRPPPLRPNRQDDQRMHAHAAYLNSRGPHARLSAPASGPVYSTSGTMVPHGPAPIHRSHLDHIAGMSLFNTALEKSMQGRASLTTANLATATLHQQVHGVSMLSVNQARVQSSQQTSRLPLPPGTPFNPAAPIFRSVLGPNREAEYRNKNERLLRTLDEQTAVIVAVQEELFNTASDIFCAIKDMKDVARSLQQGQGNEVANIKKLAYRAADLGTVLERQENWRKRLGEVAMPEVSRA
ncbi:hypothetical protein MMC17_002393 [Xylographa soralifera]|nr:hypothetical protein [Xylographa soralifera]